MGNKNGRGRKIPRRRCTNRTRRCIATSESGRYVESNGMSRGSVFKFDGQKKLRPGP